MPCENCMNEYRIKQIEDEIKRNSDSHEKVYFRLNDLEKSGTLVDYQYSQIIENLSELKTDMAELKNKPTKRLDTIITAIISSGIGAVIMYAITLL